MIQPDRIESENNKSLADFVNMLLNSAKSKQPTQQLEKFSKVYNGIPDAQKSTALSETKKYPERNAVKPIIDTRITLIGDIPFDIAVQPEPKYISDLKNLNETKTVSEVLTSCVTYVQEDNNWESLKDDFIKLGDIYGFSVSMVGFDKFNNRIFIRSINPKNIFFDPSAQVPEQSNYIVIRDTLSSFELKKRYPDKIDEIDKLASKSVGGGSIGAQQKQYKVAYSNEQMTSQYYPQQNSFYSQNSDKTIDIYEIYLLDDTVYYPNSDDDNKTLQEKEEWAFKYPNGRKVVFRDGIIFEDSAIDYEFGFPTDIYYPQAGEDIYGHSLIYDIITLQSHITKAYERLQFLIDNYISVVVFDGSSKFAQDQSWTNAKAFKTDVGGLRDDRFPRILTNNVLTEAQNLYNYINFLEEKIYDCTRINKMMMSGATESNVNSGAMVEALNDSPMSSIRASQKRFREFVISIGNKLVELIQKHYNSGQIVKLATGDQFAYMNPGDANTGGEQQLEIYHKDDLGNALKAIKGGVAIGKYMINVVTGDQIPRTKDAQSRIVMNIVNSGILEKDPNLVDFIFKAIDMPYGNQLVEMIKDQKAQAANQPPTIGALVDKLGMQYKDMPPFAQAQVLEQLGIKVPGIESNQSIQPLQEQIQQPEHLNSLNQI